MSPYTGGGGFLPLTWWLGGSSIDLWFQQGKYFDANVGDNQPITNYLTCTRASVGQALDSHGNWISFSSNTLRITDLGCLVEDSRTNNLLNSDTPATQTTASLGTGSYTLWVNGTGSALASNGSATITGAASATDGAPNTFTVTVAGTVVVTVTGLLTRFQLEQGTFPSSYIVTAGAAATRADDDVRVPFANNLGLLLRGTAGTTVSYIGKVISLTGGQNHWLRQSGNTYLYVDSSTAVQFVDDAAGNNPRQTSVSPPFSSGEYRVGASWDSSGRSVSARGGLATSATPPTAAAAIDPQIFSQNGSNNGWSYCKRFTGWTIRLSDAAFQGLTS